MENRKVCMYFVFSIFDIACLVREKRTKSYKIVLDFWLEQNYQKNRDKKPWLKN